MRRVLLTGGSRGIGAAIRVRLVQAGYDVDAPSRSELELDSDESVRAFCKAHNSNYDILVNNAGINPIAEIAEIDLQKIYEVLAVDLIAPIALMKFCAQGMISRKYGKIVNISSIWGTVSKSGRGAYSAAKAGLDAITRTAAIELGPSGILVNAVAPGFVITELTRKNNDAKALALIASTLPLRRLAQPIEIAELVYFLCSDFNTFITGQTILADGGYSCQ